MNGNSENKLWIRLGLLAVTLPLCFIFPYVLLLTLILAWEIFVNFRSPKMESVPPPRTWADATSEDSDWLDLFLKGCESPAEEKFLKTMVKEFNFYPKRSSSLSKTIHANSVQVWKVSI